MGADRQHSFSGIQKGGLKGHGARDFGGSRGREEKERKGRGFDCLNSKPAMIAEGAGLEAREEERGCKIPSAPAWG